MGEAGNLVFGFSVYPVNFYPVTTHSTIQGLEDKFDYHIRPACPKCPPPSSPSPGSAPPSVVTPSLSDMGLRPGLTRLAGLSGAAAIALGAYGAHVLNVASEGVTEEQRKAFEVANR